jgi:hypothetical protein
VARDADHALGAHHVPRIVQEGEHALAGAARRGARTIDGDAQQRGGAAAVEPAAGAPGRRAGTIRLGVGLRRLGGSIEHP